MTRRYDYRHGTEKATRLRTYHGATHTRGTYRKYEKAGSLGWCMLCPDSDTQATVVGVWRDPETGELHRNVRMCSDCAESEGVE